MTPTTKLIDAAARLGVPVNEVTKVEDSPAGLIITTFDGVRYVDVPESTPDAAGLSGLMLLVAPTKTYGGSLPVYSQPGAEADVDDATAPAAGVDLRSEVARVLEDMGLATHDEVGGVAAGLDSAVSSLLNRLESVTDRLALVDERLDRLERASLKDDPRTADDPKTADAGFDRPPPASKPGPKPAKRQGA